MASTTSLFSFTSSFFSFSTDSRLSFLCESLIWAQKKLCIIQRNPLPLSQCTNMKKKKRKEKIPVTFYTKHPLLKNRQIYRRRWQSQYQSRNSTQAWTIYCRQIPTGTTLVMYVSVKSLGSWRQPFWRKEWGAVVAPCSVRAVHWSTELPLSDGTSILGRDTQGGRHGRKSVCESFFSSLTGWVIEVQEDKLLCIREELCVFMYCFSCGSDALVSKETRWHH